MPTDPRDPWPHEHGEAHDGVHHAPRVRHDHHARLLGEPQPVRPTRHRTVAVLVTSASAVAAAGATWWSIAAGPLS